MADSNILEPVSEEDPCGPDLRYDNEYLSLSSALQEADDDEGDIAGGELADSGGVNRGEIIRRTEDMLSKTKDMGIASVRAEAMWQHNGLVAFSEAMEDIAAMAQAWPDGATGVHPRADEEDGDLGERAAPVGRLINAIPLMVRTIGWGGDPDATQRNETHERLKAVFDTWTERMGPALGDMLPSGVQAWAALQEIAKPVPVAAEAPVAGDADSPAVAGVPGAAPAPAIATTDAWDLVDRAAEMLANQDRHSPALPVLRLIATWRSKGLGEIAREMKASGVSLELLLESIERQEAAAGGGMPGMAPPGGQPQPQPPQ